MNWLDSGSPFQTKLFSRLVMMAVLAGPTMNTRSQGLKMDHPSVDTTPSLLTQCPRVLAPCLGMQCPSSKAATPTAPATPEEIIINVVFLSPPDDISDLSLAICTCVSQTPGPLSDLLYNHVREGH